MNDNERADWIDNDEGLYCWWKQSRMPKREFIRENRAEITEIIENVLLGRKQAHYLVYG